MRRVWFDHIAIGVPRIADALPFLVGELGGRHAGGGLSRAFAFRQWTFGGGKIEVLEPAGAPGGFMHRFLERRGAGVHHVTFEVPDLDDACSRAEAAGFAVVEYSDSDPDWREAFLHPKSSMSIVVQMVARGPGVPEETDRRPVPPEPGDPEPGAPGIEVIGLRLAAKSLERAAELWCGLLSGRARAGDGEIEVRWPGSSKRLVVRQVGEAAAEGPLAIEIACLRPVVVPVGPHPVLGATFDPIDITGLAPPEEETNGSASERGSGSGVVVPALPVSADDGDETYFLDGDALEREE